MQALEKALYVYSAWDGEKLVGLIRSVGDGLTIFYIQDLLVDPNYQGKGIGTKLLEDTLKKFSDVYQIVLITDDKEKTVNFYKKVGLNSGKETGVITFTKMNY
ncbi:GNAT family N-acetyltransferase [Mycoplasmatota bacterium]|nr:GNAT family N-acetyltransferase [Mycoplasmatota bacterium]